MNIIDCDRTLASNSVLTNYVFLARAGVIFGSSFDGNYLRCDD